MQPSSLTKLIAIGLLSTSSLALSGDDTVPVSQSKVLTTEATIKLPAVYTLYKDALAAANGRLLTIDREWPTYSGYSLLPFGSKNKAIAEAMSKATKSKDSYFLVATDSSQTFPANEPPPGSFMGGVYSVYRIVPIRYIDLTSESLATEIKAHATTRVGDISRQHINALINSAKDPSFRSLTSEYRDIIRKNNDEHIDGFAFTSLIGLIEYHEGKACTDDLLRWAKFHKHPQARLGALMSLISLGRLSEVEEILKSEENSAVKDAVKKALI